MVGFMINKFTVIEIDEFYKKIGRKVKEARMSKNLTQLELSFAMEYKSVSLVSAAEVYKNKKHFNLEHLYKISKVLDVDIKDLVA